MKATDLILSELNDAKSVLEAFMANEENLSKIDDASELLVEAFNNGGKAISCGNGGSSCDAAHFAEELTGRFRGDRDPLPAIAITDHAHLTCTANDFGYDRVFSRFVRALGNKGDVLFAISTSGNSKNISIAAEIAKQRGMTVIALTGKNGGELAEYADVEIRVPHKGFSDRIQEIHIKIIHIIILLIEQKMG